MATKKKKAKKPGKHKSAVTGKFVPDEFADANPDTTYKVGKKKKK